MIILSWNVRGVGRDGFTHEITELSRLYNSDILFLMKTKVNQTRADNIISQL